MVKWIKQKPLIAALFISLLSASCASTPVDLNYSVVETRQHDSSSFTQGLEIHGEHLYESSGLYGKSFVRKMDLDSGKTVIQKRLPKHWFAEGLSLLNNRVYLLSWRQQRGLVLNAEDLKPLAQFAYSGQGWGLCQSDSELIMSNGSDTLQFFDANFQALRELKVTSSDKDKRWDRLNELEYAQGLIWANIWQSDKIIGIDPSNGDVKYQLDLSSLRPKGVAPEAVLNGIAYDAERGGFWVTGKLWPQQFLLALDLPPQSQLSQSHPPQAQ